MKNIVIIAIVLLIGMPVWAQDQAGKDISFLDAGLGARPLGMGCAFTAVANDCQSAFWNPAGMLFAQKFEINSMQAKLASDYDFYYISTVLQNKSDKEAKADSAWGSFWLNGSLAEIPLVSDTEETVTHNTDVKPEDYFSYHNNAVGFSFASWLMQNVSYGINVTGFLQQFSKVSQGNGYGVSVTPGLMWLLDYQLVLGAVIKDALHYQKWETGTTEYVYPELRIGLSWEPIKACLLSMELHQKLNHKYAMTINTGVEITLFDFLKLRTGFSEAAFTAGCGFYTQYVNVNYAYTGNISDGLGDNHRVGVGIRF